MNGLLLAHHVEQFERSAVLIDVAVEGGVRSVESVADLPDAHKWCGAAPGIVFPWRSHAGEIVEQYRPDVPVTHEGVTRKYLWVAGRPLVIHVHPSHAVRVGAKKVLIVEGTKQVLAAVSHAPDDWLVLGVAGCNGWSTAGAPHPDLAALVPDGAEVVVAFDADVATNRNVWDAAAGLTDALGAVGASSVRFVNIPGSKTTGLDDYLATIPADQRRRVLANLIVKAGKLGRAPAKKKPQVAPEHGDEFFDDDGLLAVTFTEAIAAAGDYAIGRDREVWTYRDGVYVRDDAALIEITRRLIGERWRQMHHRTGMELLAARLVTEGRVLGEEPIGELVNVANGMLDVATGKLHSHHPRHLSFAQLPVVWDPAATCPRFDEWLVGRVGTQADDLMEALGLVLYVLAGQRKVPFLIGPSRSGKGTLMRLIEAVMGTAHVSAVTLHMLATSRFAAANLYGKVLNSAGDLSDAHIDDLSRFKEITGDDLITAEHKYGQPFEFHNRALIVFSANTPPTVAETSRAYLARIRPYLFPWSYEDAEDQAVEDQLRTELPGILVRFVEGVRRWRARGGYAPANPIVVDLFARQSDPVAMFVAQCCEPSDDGFVGASAVYDRYREWATANNRGTLGRNKFLARAENTLGGKVRAGRGFGPWGWRGWTLLDEADWKDDETYAQTAESVTPTAPVATVATFPLPPAHEANGSEEERVRERVREGGVGSKVATVATPPPTCDDTPPRPNRRVF